MSTLLKYLWKNSEQVDGHTTHDEYVSNPVKAFLTFSFSAKQSIEFCKYHFPPIGNQGLYKNGKIHIQHLTNATLCSLMGHFETFQKHLFAGIFDRTVYFEKFEQSSFFKDLNKKDRVDISTTQLLGFRGDKLSVGLLLADTLKGWQDPEDVNDYFNAFELNHQLWNNEVIAELRLLWQLRHSIVHTASTITKPDSQKVEALKEYGGKNIVCSNKFIYEVVRFLHLSIPSTIDKVKLEVEAKLPSTITAEEKIRICNLFDYSNSPLIGE
jgi:hypothetical protein